MSRSGEAPAAREAEYEERRVEPRALDGAAARRRMHELAVAEVDADVVGRRVEEHEVAGREFLAAHVLRRRTLLGGRARHADAELVKDEVDEAGAVEAGRRVAAEAVRGADEGARERGGARAERGHRWLGDDDGRRRRGARRRARAAGEQRKSGQREAGESHRPSLADPAPTSRALLLRPRPAAPPGISPPRQPRPARARAG